MKKTLKILSVSMIAAVPIGATALAAGGNHMDCNAQIGWIMRYVNQMTYTQEKVEILAHLENAKEDMLARREEACVAQVAIVKQMLGVSAS